MDGLGRGWWSDGRGAVRQAGWIESRVRGRCAEEKAILAFLSSVGFSGSGLTSLLSSTAGLY